MSESRALHSIFRSSLAALVLVACATPFTLNAQVAAPIIEPLGGIGGTTIAVQVTSATPGATLHFTLNGEDPTGDDEEVASGGSIPIGSHTTLKVRAFLDADMSHVVTEEYTIAGELAAGNWHILSLKNDGRELWAWGANSFGQLGDGTTSSRNTPVRVMEAPGVPLTGVRAIAAGGHGHSLALMQDGTVLAWGDGGFGHNGNGSTANQSYPVLVEKTGGTPLTNVIAIADGAQHSLAVTSNGEVWAWGSGGYGRIGDGATSNRTRAVRVEISAGVPLTGVVQVAAGNAHSTAITSSGSIFTWGRNLQRQLGLGHVADRDRPHQVTLPHQAIFITCGPTNTFAAALDGSVIRTYGWGENGTSYRIPNGTSDSAIAWPSELLNAPSTPLTGIFKIAAGWKHGLGVHENGSVLGWGTSNYGQVGDGTTNILQYPVPVVDTSSQPLTNIISVVSGYEFSAALSLSGEVYVWGHGQSGQMGNATNSHTNTRALQSAHHPQLENMLPSITLASLTGPLEAPASITLTATVSDTDGEVDRVLFFNHGSRIASVLSSPFELPLILQPGSYEFSALAVDDVSGITPSNSFTLEVEGTGGDVDSDGDDLPDWWEMQYFGSLETYSGSDIHLNTGLTYYEVYIQGRNPLVGTIADSGGSVGLLIYSRLQ